MRKNKLLLILFISAFSPILIGSLVFYYWFNNLFYNAIDSRIEGKALSTILFYFICLIVTVITSTQIIIRHKKDWKIIIIPILCIFATFFVIDVFDRFHTTMTDKASFVRVKRDSDNYKINRIWSKNFELTYIDSLKTDFVFHYFPVREYDWIPHKEYYDGASFNKYDYKLNELYIDLIKSKTDTLTFKLCKLDKGQQLLVKISEIVKTNPNIM